MLSNFTCPNCKAKGQIESIQEVESISVPIKDVSKDIVEYGEVEVSSDIWDIRFQCSSCGYVLNDISNDEELILFLS